MQTNIEGITKYIAEHLDGNSPNLDTIMQINNCRTELHKLGLIGADHNLLGYGNISCRLDNNCKFVISGTQTGHISILESQHYARVCEYSLSNNSLKSCGKIRPSSEALSHAAVYHAFPLVNCVIHVHNLSLWNKLLFKSLTTSTKCECGTSELALEIVEILTRSNSKNDQILVLGGHQEGLISFGKSPESAMEALLKVISD